MSIIQVKFYKCWQKELRIMSTGHCPVSVLIAQSQWLSWYSVLKCQCLKGHQSPKSLFESVLAMYLILSLSLTSYLSFCWSGHGCSSLWSNIWVYDTYIEQIYGEPSLELLRCQEGFLHCALALRELYCVYVGVALQGHVWGLPLTESSRVENWDWCGIMADSKNNVGGKMYPYMLRTPESCWHGEHHH